jgi:hypothetical protein
MTATQLPSELTAGDTWQWTRTLAAYPAPTWTATVYFQGGSKALNAVAVASGTDHSFSISAAATSALPPGGYKWTVRVTDGTNKFTAESGWVDVRRDPASTGNADPRSWARRTLEAIECTLEGRATSDQLAMQIKDRSISHIPIPELMDLRDRIRQEVRAEDHGSKAGIGRNIKVRLGRA